jgi:glyoxylate utilization-related uncharacterized protein
MAELEPEDLKSDIDPKTEVYLQAILAQALVNMRGNVGKVMQMVPTLRSEEAHFLASLAIGMAQDVEFLVQIAADAGAMAEEFNDDHKAALSHIRGELQRMIAERQRKMAEQIAAPAPPFIELPPGVTRN